MGLWGSIKSIYSSVDKKVGGILPGGVPKQSTSTPSSQSTSSPSSSSQSQSTSSSSGGSSGGGRTSGGGGGGGNVQVTELAPKQQDAVIVTDFTTGESVKTTVGSSGRVTSQTVNVIGGDEKRAGELVAQSTRPEGLVSQTQEKKAATYTEPTSSGGFTLDKSNRDDPMTLGSPVVAQYGTPVITQQEAKKYGINPKTTPVYVLSSTDPAEMSKEFAFASSLPYTIRGTQTKDLVISNLANIRTGQEIYRLNKQGATNIDVSYVYSKSVLQAQRDYSTLPRGERFKLWTAGVGQGIISLGVKTVEFGGTVVSNMGVRTTETGEFEKVEFKIGGSVGRAANYPVARSSGFFDSPKTYVKETLNSPSSLVGVAAVTGGTYSFTRKVARIGAYEAAAETASFFSPFKVKGGVYGSSVTSETKFNVRSEKYTTPEGVTNRAYAGVSDDIVLFGQEKIVKTRGGGVVGGGYSFTQAPFTEIRAGGAIIESGTRSTLQPYVFESSAVAGRGYGARGNAYISEQLTPNIPGSTSMVITSRGLTIYETPKGATIYNDFSRGIVSTSGGVVSDINKPVSKFVSGRARAIYKIEGFGDTRVNLNTGQTSRDFIYEPTGRYKVQPQFYGRELDLNKILGGQSDKGYSSFRGGGFGGRTQQTFTSPVQAPAPQINIQRQVTAPRVTATAVPVQLERTRSQFYGTGLYERTLSQSEMRILQAPTSSNILAPVVMTSSIQGAISRTQQRTLPVSAGSYALVQTIGQVQTPQIATRIGIGSLTGLDIRQNYRFDFTTPNVPGGASSFGISKLPTFTTGGGGFALPMISGFGGDVGTTIIQGGKRRTGYTPSFNALIFNLRGQYKGGGALSRSGLDFRPIVSGFKFKTGLGKARLKI